jgi:hypothetical protein
MAIRFTPYNRSTPFGVPDYAGAAAADDAVAAQNRARTSGEIGGAVATASAWDQATKNRESQEKMMEMFAGAKEGDSVTADQLRAMGKVEDTAPDAGAPIVEAEGMFPQNKPMGGGMPVTGDGVQIPPPGGAPIVDAQGIMTGGSPTGNMLRQTPSPAGYDSFVDYAMTPTTTDALNAGGQEAMNAATAAGETSKAATDVAATTDAAGKASGGLGGVATGVGALGAAAQLAEGDVGGAAKTGLSTYLSTLGPYGMAAGLLMNLF